MRIDSTALAAASAAVVLLALPAPVHAIPAAAESHTCVNGRPDSRGRSSVDGDELAWDDASKFDDARDHAVEVWTAGTLGQVRTGPDGATSYADLEWRDANSTAADWHLVYGKCSMRPVAVISVAVAASIPRTARRSRGGVPAGLALSGPGPGGGGPAVAARAAGADARAGRAAGDVLPPGDAGDDPLPRGQRL